MNFAVQLEPTSNKQQVDRSPSVQEAVPLETQDFGAREEIILQYAKLLI